MPLSIPVNAEGFIVCQAATAHIPYGKITSNYSGCGWIAAYNLLLALGKSPDAGAVSRALARGWFRGLLGTGPLRLRRFLAGQGVKTKTATGFRRANILIQNAKAGILMYLHGKEPHYVAFITGGGAKKTFLNVEDAHPAVTATLMDYKRRYAVSPLCYLMVAVC